jgi:hypothetical protein
MIAACSMYLWWWHPRLLLHCYPRHCHCYHFLTGLQLRRMMTVHP